MKCCMACGARVEDGQEFCAGKACLAFAARTGRTNKMHPSAMYGIAGSAAAKAPEPVQIMACDANTSKAYVISPSSENVSYVKGGDIFLSGGGSPISEPPLRSADGLSSDIPAFPLGKREKNETMFMPFLGEMAAGSEVQFIAQPHVRMQPTRMIVSPNARSMWR